MFTEEQWYDCTDPELMIGPSLGGSVRKARSLINACCRRLSLLMDIETRQSREELLSELERRAEEQTADNWVDAVVGDTEVAERCETVAGCEKLAECYWRIQFAGLAGGMTCAAMSADDFGTPWRSEQKVQSALVRCVFGNPFRPVAFDPAWRSSTVVALAQGIYDDRAFDRMPILADALQDAGCDNDDLLNHCRDEKQVHARGCWVVDLVLGKT